MTRRGGTSRSARAKAQPALPVRRDEGPTLRILSSIPVRLAALALLLVVAYGGSLQAGASWDDLEILSSNPEIRTLSRPWRFFTDSATIGPHAPAWRAQYRPLRTLGYALQYAAFGGDAWGYHLVSLLLHALGALAVGRLTFALFARGGWTAAAVWLIHPVLSESVLSLAAQANLLCVLLAALALLWHLEWLESSSPRRRVASLAAAFGAMLAYESGALLPLLVIVAEGVWGLKGVPTGRGRLARHLPFWLLLACYLGLRHAATEAIPSAPWWGGSWSASLALQLRVWTEAWRLTFAPVGLPVRYLPADLPALLSPALAAAFHVALFGSAAWAAARRRRLVPLLAIAWWYLAQAPTSNLIVPNLGYPFAPRFLFLALLLPVAAVAAALADVAAARPRTSIALAGVLLLLAIVADRRQTAIWHDGRTLFTAMVERSPDDFPARFNLGWIELKTGHPAVAATQFERARALSPSDGRPAYWLGEIARADGRPDQARALYRSSLETEPRQVEPRVRLAQLDLAERRHEQAAQWLAPIPAAAARSGPSRSLLELTRAELALLRGDCREALDRARNAAAIRPASSRVTFGAAVVLSRCGRREDALELFPESARQARSEVVDMVGGARAFP